MAIQPVPPIDPALPEFPGPNTPEAQYDDAAYNWGSAIPGYGNRVKAIGDNVFNNANAAASILALCEDAQRLTEMARDTAMGVANFKGDWVNLSGPLSRPATVQHNDSVWLLMRDVANVAAEVPGVSTAWVNQTARVSSVMGRTGDVTGLVQTTLIDRGAALMSGAGSIQPEVYYSAGAAGADWPTNQTNARWVLETPGGLNGAVQRATQTNANAQRGWVFERYWQGSNWTAWVRVFTASTVMEQVALHTNVSGAITCDPAAGSMQMVGMVGNLTISIPAPRAMGDQLTIRIYQTGSFSLTFGSNVALPVGATLPTLAFGEWLTVTLCTDNGLTKWFLFVAGRHAG